MNPQDIGILIVDDEFSVRDSLYNWFAADGYRVGAAENANEALTKLQESHWDIVLLDIKMPGMDGIELQKRIKEIKKDIITIVITAFASVDTAIQALKDGAYDYVCKPIDPDELSHLIRNAIDKMALLTENVALRERVDELFAVDEIVGSTPAMNSVLKMVAEVAKSDSTVMIRGESGTGKELIAKAIHMNSNRRYFPLITMNCGAYPESLIESELFGHEKGAFTGAQYTRKGKLEMADKGTIFFDEIGDISTKMQIDILRAIETKQFYRLGGSKEITSNFRVISATNKDLEQLVKQGEFREDLYYRLNVFMITLPPIRERIDDVTRLAEYFLKKYCQSMNKNIEGFTPRALERMRSYSWPGNVRELRNVIERAVVVVRGKLIDVEELSFPSSQGGENQRLQSLQDVERRHIASVLDQTGWNITRAAEVLKVDRVTIYNKIKKYDLKK
ncbi:MAG: sigma-54 dependent transcriptional regulator [Candidatus Alcyoniella australis]|nr:sigma-54 dependent transcriptional regulator [Candidatus Alcyoniella australis]